MLGGVTRTTTSLKHDSTSYKRLVPEYFRRIAHYPQMDMEYTFWIMFYLCFNPSRVYRTTSWHKQTKNQWARDDPAFVAILIFFMSIASMAYSIAFHSLWIDRILITMFWAVFFDFIAIGLAVATIGWWLSNKFLRESAHHHSVDQKVEWLYAFDIHCNSFFPLFIILYVIQYFLLPILLSRTSLLSTILSNTLFLVAIVYYYYITFLGYNALPFIQNARVFLFPIVVVLIIYILLIVLNINMTNKIMSFYFGYK